MRLGIGTYALAWNIGIPGFEPEKPLDVFGVLDIARELEVQAVQYADNLPLETLPEADLDRLEAQAREAGIVLEVGARGLDMPRIERCIELAERFGSGFVRLVVDSAGDEPTPQEAVARLNVLKPKLEAHGVKLAIENHDRFPSKTLARMIEKLGPDRFAICLDTANSLGCLEGPKQVMRVLAPYTVNVHIKDVKVERANHNLGFTVTGTAAGEGSIDIAPLLQMAKWTAPSLTIELWPAPNPDGTPPFGEERAMLARSVVNLRKEILEASRVTKRRAAPASNED